MASYWCSSSGGVDRCARQNCKSAKGPRPERSASKGRLRIAINVASPRLPRRIASVLSNVEGVELVGASLEADAVIVATTAPGDADAEVALTARELEVLALLAEGASNKLIARRLGISTHTAKYSRRIVVREARRRQSHGCRDQRRKARRASPLRPLPCVRASAWPKCEDGLEFNPSDHCGDR